MQENATPTNNEVSNAITSVCHQINDLLLSKNRMYGNAALEPVNIFAKNSTPEDYLNQQIDLKISRIKNQQPDETEDTELDIIGYLILKQVNRRLKKNAPVDGIKNGKYQVN